MKSPTANFALIALVLLLVSSSPATASLFDGERKGFVLQLSAGNTMYERIDVEPFDPEDVIGYSPTIGLQIGWGFDNRNIVAWGFTVNNAKSEQFDTTNVNLALTGAKWLHFWGPYDGQISTRLGLGILQIGSQFSNVRGRGFGFEAGVSYEWVEHIMFDLLVIGGRSTTDRADNRSLHLAVVLQLSALVY